MSDASEWPPELIEWVYGPPGDPDDEPPSVGEVYAVQEEEERIRWIPGCKELVLQFIEASRRWHAQWKPGEPYPPETEEHKQLAARVSAIRRERVEAPYDAWRREGLPW